MSSIFIHRRRTIVCYLTAEVANTCPLDPTDRTITEATTTIRSARRESKRLEVETHISKEQFTEQVWKQVSL